MWGKCDYVADVVKRRLTTEFTHTEHNATAVRYLEAARQSLDVTRERFAELLSDELGLTITPITLSYYLGAKSRSQTVPAAVMIAATRLSGLPLLDEGQGRTLAERLARLEGWMARVEALLQHVVPPTASGPHYVSGLRVPEPQ